jgi:hypothetical protein
LPIRTSSARSPLMSVTSSAPGGLRTIGNSADGVELVNEGDVVAGRLGERRSFRPINASRARRSFDSELRVVMLEVDVTLVAAVVVIEQRVQLATELRSAHGAHVEVVEPLGLIVPAR